MRVCVEDVCGAEASDNTFIGNLQPFPCFPLYYLKTVDLR